MTLYVIASADEKGDRLDVYCPICTDRYLKHGVCDEEDVVARIGNASYDLCSACRHEEGV